MSRYSLVICDTLVMSRLSPVATNTIEVTVFLALLQLAHCAQDHVTSVKL